MKAYAKKILPNSMVGLIKSCLQIMRLAKDYGYDLLIFHKYNGAKTYRSIAQLEGRIIAHYHVLEKGLSHPSPKDGFGIGVAENLVRLIDEYDELSPNRPIQVRTAVSVLYKYKDSPSNDGHLPAHLIKSIENLEVSHSGNSGSLTFKKEAYFSSSDASFGEFCLSRYSVRDFSKENVSIEVIKDAIKLAQKTPSVCNRQTCKAYVLTETSEIRRHLMLQNGNRGFGEKIDKLIIVTSDLSCFEGSTERNQAFVDGGMFAMSLLYGLHYKKLGAVALNWSYDSAQDRELHRLGIIPRNEKVILFIGVGHPSSEFKVAASCRRDIGEVAKII